MVFITDKNHKIVRVNKTYANLFKMEPQECIGKTCYEMIHETNEPVPNCPHQKTLETKKPATAEFFEPHLGIYLQVSTSPMFNNKGEIDVAAFNPRTKHLVHIETSTDADSWTERKRRFVKKFEDAKKHYQEIFDFQLKTVECKAIVGFSQKTLNQIDFGNNIHVFLSLSSYKR